MCVPRPSVCDAIQCIYMYECCARTGGDRILNEQRFVLGYFSILCVMPGSDAGGMNCTSSVDPV